MNLNARIACPECRYDLRGLLTPDGVRCPECGGTFTQSALSDATHAATVRWVPLSIPIMLVTGPIAYLVSYLLGPPVQVGVVAVVGLPYIAGAVWCFAILDRADQVSQFLAFTGIPHRRPANILLSMFLAAIFYPIVLMGWALTIGILVLVASLF